MQISHSERKTLVLRFKKRTEKECPRVKFTYFNTTTENNENIVFYNYYEHLRKFGFEWENDKLDYKYTTKLSKDEKNLIKKMTMSKQVRCKICVGESRIWNMDTTNAKRKSFLTGFLYKEKHLLDYFKITNSKDLYPLTPAEKCRCIRYYPLKTHGSTAYKEQDVFYSIFNLGETVMFHVFENMLIYYGRRIQRLFVPKFYHNRNTENILKCLEYVGEYDRIDQIGYSEFPSVLGRKLYECKNKPGDGTRNTTLTIKDQDFTFPRTYFKSVGVTIDKFFHKR